MKTHEFIAALKRRMGNPDRPGQTGINAALRRMDPAHPGASSTAAFTAMAEAGMDLDKLHARQISAWLLIVHTMALSRWRHEPRIPVGHGLVAMHLSENRLKQLLSADFGTLQQLLPRIARRFAGCTDVPGMDFKPLARLILAASAWPDKLEQARLDIALSYTRFQNQTNTDKRKAS